MSYSYIKTGDLTNDYITKIADFMNVLPNLVNAKSPEVFGIWYEKLEQIDRRSLTKYLVEHIDDIPTEYLHYIVNHHWRGKKKTQPV